ncbi:MAG: iron-containing alcohol dehydrogenase, partial [Eubacteriales bacterium]
MQTFTCKPQIFFGGDALSQLGRRPCDHLLLVTDPFFQSSGIAQTVANHVPTSQVTMFAQVTPDPDTGLVAKAVAVMEETHPDLVIALGGGSPIDCAKAMIFAG